MSAKRGDHVTQPSVDPPLTWREGEVRRCEHEEAIGVTRALERSPSSFTAESRTLDHGVVALRLVGELDAHSAAPLHDALHAAAVGARAVLVDLSEVTYLGSVGVSALLGVYT